MTETVWGYNIYYFTLYFMISTLVVGLLGIVYLYGELRGIKRIQKMRDQINRQQPNDF